nr:unnamed protein product [Callosobruchus chinensis]
MSTFFFPDLFYLQVISNIFFDNHFRSNLGNRKKRNLEDPDLIHYGVNINGKDYQVELWPNHGFISPNLVIERRRPNEKVKDKELKLLDENKVCHYTGRVRGHEGSRAAISTCDGLAGYITIDDMKYFIEPVEDHQPNEQGHHLHMVYQRHPRIDRSANNVKCGTDEDWESAWKKRFRDKMLHGGHVERRGTESIHRYLETLIVMDKKFLGHHKHRDVDTYVLTIMNMVADFYHDASSGNQMDVVIVRMMYLEKEEEEVDLQINTKAPETLKSFCKWQQGINPKDIENPHHHDIAVLLTRYDICDGDNCGLVGLAYVATACTKESPCAINEDSGLQLGTTVAHEMGHVMGCSHDKENNSPCPAQDPQDGSYYVMSPSVHLYTHRWSTCSRGFITALFENNLGECLNDEPTSAVYKYKNALPGSVYDAEEQCRLAYPGSKVCTFSPSDFCAMLACEVGPEECLSNNEPPADGTKCGTNQWCFHGKCVEVGERPEAINGGWGEWGEWSSCSRTCGGGVAFSTRDCNKPVPQYNGRYCIGERKKFKVCNAEACPEASPSFRQVQCSEKDKDPFEGQMVHWKEYFRKEEPCVLYCINENRVLTALAKKCKDGTPCKPGTKDLCIGGVCKHVGCDNKLDSTAVEDVCGVCNGDGTQCKLFEEIYRDKLDLGYRKVAMIPAKARMIRLEELAPSKNVIAVSDRTEKVWYLNGNNDEELDGVKKFGKVEGVYEHVEPGKELVLIHGPTQEDLIFHVAFYKKENVGYRYKYAEATTELSYTPHYHWELLEWTDCSAKCGGGEQTSKYDCVEDKAGKVSDSYCTGEEKPEATTKRCNEQPCAIKWKVGKWGECHACKGKSGVRGREVECVQESPRVGGDDILVEDDKCTETRPAARELCHSDKACRRKRGEGEIPDKLMRGVWRQIHRRSLNESETTYATQCFPITHSPTNADQNTTSSEQSSNATSAEQASNATTETPHKANVTLQHVGEIVVDKMPDDEVKLIKFPMKQIRLNLSDNIFESIGDELSDNLDTANASIVTGDEARKIMKEMQKDGDDEDEEEEKGNGTVKSVSWKGEN